MKYYFFDTSGIFGNYRREQRTNEMGSLFFDAIYESSGGKPAAGYKNIIVSHILPYELIKGLISKRQNQADSGSVESQC